MKIFFKSFFIGSLITLSCQLFSGQDYLPGEVIKKCLLGVIRDALPPPLFDYDIYKRISSMESKDYLSILKEVQVNACVRSEGVYNDRVSDTRIQAINDFEAGLKSAGDLKFDELIKRDIVALINAFNKVMGGESDLIHLPEFLRKESKQKTEVKGFSERSKHPETIASKPTQTLTPNPEQIAETLKPDIQINSPDINPQTGEKPKLNGSCIIIKRKADNLTPPAYTKKLKADNPAPPVYPNEA